MFFEEKIQLDSKWYHFLCQASVEYSPYSLFFLLRQIL